MKSRYKSHNDPFTVRGRDIFLGDKLVARITGMGRYRWRGGAYGGYGYSIAFGETTGPQDFAYFDDAVRAALAALRQGLR